MGGNRGESSPGKRVRIPSAPSDWRLEAACKDTYHPVFFPDHGRLKALKLARVWCDNCTVRQQCRDYRYRNNIQDGIWGGEFYQRKAKR